MSPRTSLLVKDREGVPLAEESKELPPEEFKDFLGTYEKPKDKA